jgi:hypothetical protein
MLIGKEKVVPDSKSNATAVREPAPSSTVEYRS